MDEIKLIPKLRFPEFKSNWQIKKLAEIANIKGGKRIPKGYNLLSEDNGFPYITVSDMAEGTVSLKQIKFVPLEISDQIKNYKITTQDIFISVAGTLGVVGIVPDQLNQANLTENANKLTNIKCNQHFLLQFLKSDKLKKLIKNVSTTGAQPKLAIYALSNFDVSITKIPEQQKIADFLTAVDTKIQQLTRKKALLEKYKKGVSRQIFNQEIRFKEDDGNDFAEWKKKKLGDLGELTSSKRIYLSEYVNEGIPFFRGKEITELKKNIIPSDILFISEEIYETYRVKYGSPQKGDILITAVGTLANIYRIPKDYKFYFKDGNLIWLRNITENSMFIELSLEFNKPQIIKSSIGSTQKALTIVELKKILLKIPSLDEQRKIAEFLSELNKKVEFVNLQLQQAQAFKKGLLQQMFI